MNAVPSALPAKVPIERLPDVRAAAARQADPVAWAVAGAVWSGLQHGMQASALLRGIPADELEEVARHCFPPLTFAALTVHCGERAPDRYDEFDDLLALLLSHARDGSARVRWLAHAIASASMYENHLWQDLHLPSRTVLSELLDWGFPTLAARNTHNMKWKKFFYKQLCDAAQVMCKSPTCSSCSDYSICFGSEDPEEAARPAVATPTAGLTVLR